MEELQHGHINGRVFTTNNHYLTHVAALTRLMDPLKSYSAHSTERTIKKFSNLIASKTKPGINSTNILLKLTNYNSNLIRQLEDDEKALSETSNDEEY